MNILITGANGFIGQEISKFFIKKNKCLWNWKDQAK